MAEQKFTPEFKGYYREPNKGSLPKSNGIYCVFECTLYATAHTVTLHKLIYIGESEDINGRVGGHDKLDDWQKHVRQGNQLCYSYTLVDPTYRVRVEAAFIHHHKPQENTEYVDNFPFDKTIVDSSGTTTLLEKYFVANRT